jgi:hypothetical protein
MKGTGDNGAVQMSGLPLPPLSLFESLLLLFYFGKRKEKLEALLSCTSSRLLVFFFFAFAKGTGIVLDFPNRPDPRIHGAASKVWRNLNDEETKRSKQSHALWSLIYVPSSTDSISRRTLLLFVLAEQKQQRCVATTQVDPRLGCRAPAHVALHAWDMQGYFCPTFFRVAADTPTCR